jgi:hypothetical protein
MVVRPPPIRLMVRVLAFDKGGWRNSTARLRLKYASPGGRVRCVFLTFSAPRTSSFFRPKKCEGDCRPDQTERARSPGNDRGVSNSTRPRSWPMRCKVSPSHHDVGLPHDTRSTANTSADVSFAAFWERVQYRRFASRLSALPPFAWATSCPTGQGPRKARVTSRRRVASQSVLRRAGRGGLKIPLAPFR